MILKSYEIENKINLIIRYRSVLFYGENIGLKDTFKEHVEDPDMFEKEFIKYLKENVLGLFLSGKGMNVIHD